MTAAQTRGDPYRHVHFEVPPAPRRTRWGLVAAGVVLAALLDRCARRVPVERTTVGDTRRDAAPYHVLRFLDDRVEPLRDVVAFAPRPYDGLALVRANGETYRVNETWGELRDVATRTGAPAWRSTARAVLGLQHDARNGCESVPPCLWIDALTQECAPGLRTPVPRDPYHSRSRVVCELRDGGTARCRGGVASGRVHRRQRPAPIAADARFTALAMADDVTCGVTADSGVGCWGPSLRPVFGVRNARALALRPDLGCALLTDGGVSCWPMTRDTVPRVAERAATRVEHLPPAVSIAATEAATCALDAHGTVRCWGAFGRAWPGHPRAYHATRPLEVVLPAPTASLHPTLGHAMCAQDIRGVTRCWGGPPESWGRERAVATLGDTAADATWVQDPPTTPSDLRLLDDGRVLVRNPRAPRGWSALGDLPRTRALVAMEVERTRADGYPSRPHACALAMDGVAWCWGDNGLGQLGLDDAPRPDAWTTVVVAR